MPERIKWIDTAKGLGIIAVILGHIGTGYLGKWIYTFHIPLFFFLSGYVFSTKHDWKTFLRKKERSILVPYFTLGIPMLVFDTFLTTKGFVPLLEGFLLQERQYTLWYLAVLFLLNLSFYGLFKLTKNIYIIGIVVILASFCGYTYYNHGGGAIPWDVDIYVMAMPFFFVGYLFKLRYETINQFFEGHKYLWTIVFLVVNLGLAYICGGGIDMFGGSYGMFPITYITAFAGMFFIIQVSKWILSSRLQYLGKNSLIYFAWHQTIVFPIVWKIMSICHYPLDSENLYIYGAEKVTQLVLIIVIITVLNELILKSRLKFMLGK